MELKLSEARASVRDARVVWISVLAIVVAGGACVAALVLTRLIALATNLAFFGRFSLEQVSPATARPGAWTLIVPALGGILVGLMARFGSSAIRGHGIPEAMERVLFAQSRVPARLIALKPLSSAVAIGTGGPFGAEGPIIATGGALGSFLGQVVRVTADERKTLLAAGAAAGMAATFGTPIAAVVLAVELLLFEYRSRSLIPVAFATVTATALRTAVVGGEPVFPMPAILPPAPAAFLAYALLGAGIGVAAVLVTRVVYAMEDAFEKLPIHWMWWPAIGGLAVGAVGLVAPRTLGVGYDNIVGALNGSIAGRAALTLCLFKLASFIVSLGSGTSGGTLAPLFTVGGCLGAVFGGVMASFAPSLGVDPRLAALVGMASIFAGASRAVLASVLFAFETTHQGAALLPLLAGCVASFLVSSLAMKHSIMTEKIARRGTHITTELGTDYLAHVQVRERASRSLITVAADRAIEDARSWLLLGGTGARHAGFPVIRPDGTLVGFVTRSQILEAPIAQGGCIHDLVAREAVVAFEDESLRDAADRMVTERVGRLVVVARADPRRPLGILSGKDILAAHEVRLDASGRAEVHLPLASLFFRGERSADPRGVGRSA